MGRTHAFAGLLLTAACSPVSITGLGGAGGGATTAAAQTSTGSGGMNASTSATTAGPGTGPGATTSAGPGATTSTGTGGGVVPPIGGSSGGSGGPAPVSGTTQQAGSIAYRLVVPTTYSPATPSPLLVVFSGTEGGAQMTMNLVQVAQVTGTSGFIEAVLDGVTYNGNGAAGATVLDNVRSAYNVDNDRTYLLGESAGTTAAEQLGFHLRESYFAAYWANDIIAPDGPATTASALGFAPWGQVGPGGDLADGQVVVTKMQAAGYRLPNPAPYAGPGSGTHGDPNQFLAAMQWFVGKSRN